MDNQPYGVIMCKESEFMKAQIHKIEVDKWCRGVDTHQDPGEVYVINWVYNNAEKFRNDWNSSVCPNCSNYDDCGYLVLSSCDKCDRTNN